MNLTAAKLQSRAGLALSQGRMSQADHDFCQRMLTPGASFSWLDLIKFIPFIGVLVPELAPILAFLPQIQNIVNAILELINVPPINIPVVPPDGGGELPMPK